MDAETQRRLQYATRIYLANEKIREIQHGMGPKIPYLHDGRHAYIIIGERPYTIPLNAAPTDVIFPYVRDKLGPDWYDHELSRVAAERHPILQWHERILAKAPVPSADGLGRPRREWDGASYCYLGLAYSLMLLENSTDVQERLLHRLRNIDELQGAYYELIIFGVLIRAGFNLILENDVDGSTGHVECIATSPITREEFCVEVKSHAVEGILGKSRDRNASKLNGDPTSRLSAHVNAALRKPRHGRRMLIFVDINAAPDDALPPLWERQARRRLTSMDHSIGTDAGAYVFVTNIAFHRSLDEDFSRTYTLVWALGNPDFSGPLEPESLVNAYRRKQRHIDAHRAADAISAYPRIPPSFDGALASEVLSGRPRILIGDTHTFGDDSGGVVTGLVRGIGIDPKHFPEIEVALEKGADDIERFGFLLTEDELADFRLYGAAYFGDVDAIMGANPMNVFEQLVDKLKFESRERVLLALSEQERNTIDQSLGDEDFLLSSCEMMAQRSAL